MADFNNVKVDAPKVNFASITNDFLVDFISNSISLDTLNITRDVVEKIINGNTTEVDEKVVLLVKDYLDGLLFAVRLASENKPFTDNDLKDLHQIIVRDKNFGGLYRNVDISIKGSNHTPPSFVKVYDRMKKYFDTINDPELETWYKIAFSHAQLMKVHPFLDGNGRCARIVLNYHLLKNGLNPVVISHEDKEKYFELLEEFKVNKNIEPLIQYLKDLQK